VHFRWMAALAAPLVIVVLLAGTAWADGAGGVSGPAFYVDGELYRTVGTPTHHLGDTGAPDHSYDTIYDIGGQPNVATAAPGDPGFNGGRWMVIPVTFTNYAMALAMYDANMSSDFDSADEVHAAVDGGAAFFGAVIDQFECPVIPVPRNAK